MSARPAGTGILVLGMHRSGTSAVAGALGEIGVALGERLIDAAPDNPQGYFENTDAVLANEKLLDALDRAWDDVRALPGGWLESAAAADAARAIHDEVVPAFADSALWALKDPRMCRTLPLWTRELARAGVRPLGLLVARHPDEVAGSLGTRDGMHPRAARLLWLRHVLEAAQAAPETSAVLRYDALLADPARAMRGALESLGLSLVPSEQRLRRFLVPDARHHRAGTAPAEDELHALSLETYEALGHSAWRERLRPLGERLAALENDAGGWIEALGMAARGADRRRRSATAEVLAAQQRMDLLQTALDAANAVADRHVRDLAELDRASRATSEGLERAEAIARERGAEAERLAFELTRTQEAKSAAEALVAEATGEARVAAEQLRKTEEALHRAEEHSRHHLSDLARLSRELAATAKALRAAEALVEQRVQEAAATRDELERTQDALRDAQGLVESRTAEGAMLSTALGITQRALSTAESLVEARTAEVADLGARLVDTQQALGAAESLVATRTAEAATLVTQLGDTEHALASAEALVRERTAEAGRLEAQLAATQQALAAAETLVHARVAEVESVSVELARTQQALGNVQALALARLADIERLSALLDAEHAARQRADVELDSLRSRASSLQAALDEAAAGLADARVLLARISNARLWPAFARVSGLPRGPIE